MSVYLLPDGTRCRTKKAYIAGWKRIAKSIEQLTNSTLFAFDPSLWFQRNDDKRPSTFEVQPWLAILIGEKLKLQRKKKCSLSNP